MATGGSRGSRRVDGPEVSLKLSGRESRNRPRFAVCPFINDTVVESTGAALPELNSIGANYIPAPVGRARHIATFEPFFDFSQALLQDLSRSDHFALW